MPRILEMRSSPTHTASKRHFCVGTSRNLPDYYFPFENVPLFGVDMLFFFGEENSEKVKLRKKSGGLSRHPSKKIKTHARQNLNRKPIFQKRAKLFEGVKI